MYQALIPIEKKKLTFKNKGKCVCAQCVNKIMRKINNTRIFVNEVETQDEKNHSTIQKTRLDTR